MKKSEFLEAIKDLSDDDHIAVGLIFEKEESFEIGSEEGSDDSLEDGEDGTVDNGDGTFTACNEILSVDIIDDVEDLEGGGTKPIKIALLNVDMIDDDEDEDEDEDGDDDDN